MATVICVDGLGGLPETTFCSLKKTLEQIGHKVIIVDTSCVSSHEDRVQLTLNEYQRQLAPHLETQIFLLGQSAGGSAVRIAAERLWKRKMPVAGVVQLSSAVPKGIVFMTRTLCRTMIKRLREILFGRIIYPTKAEYEKLVAPIAEDMEEIIVRDRQQVSGKEARELAFFPPRFVGYSFPTLQIFGTKDVWIAPSAQRKLSAKLSQKSHTTVHEVKGAGHLTLASEKRDEVLSVIQEWIRAHT